MITDTGTVLADDTRSAVSWKAILAGGTASAAITLFLMAFGVGVGFSVVSPWADRGISGTTFGIAAGLYLVVVAMLSSTIGGYLAGRLRSQWKTTHEHARYFRDTAHGFLVWAFATVLCAALLGAATTHILSGATAGFGGAAAATATAAPTDVYVDTLLRADPGTPGAAQPNANANATRAEVGRILVPSVQKNGNLSDADRTYLAKLVVARTGLSQPEAEKRVNDTIAQAKAAADAARKSAAKFSLWLAFAMLAGALSASLAAVEGGNLRNREWYLTR